jgi:hypothetical protein
MEPQAALKEWQEALSLQHWDIEARLLSEAEFSLHALRRGAGYESQGVNSITPALQASVIAVSTASEDQERTLVHELVHIILEPMFEAAKLYIEHLPNPACLIGLNAVRAQNEIATEHLARAFMKVRDMAQESRNECNNIPENIVSRDEVRDEMTDSVLNI